MAQKTNSLGLRLGLVQTWDIALQIYGKNNKYYSDFIVKQSILNNFLNSWFYIYLNKLINTKLTMISYKKTELKLSCTNRNLALINDQLQRSNLIENILERIYANKVKVKIFHNYKLCITASLIARYVKYLFECNFSLKLIIANLNIFLKSQLDLRKIVSLKNGNSKIVLKGFKLKVSGRFENTRNRMAKSYEYSYGMQPLIKLNTYVEFFSQPIFTKLGICIFHIWLFYEIENAQ